MIININTAREEYFYCFHFRIRRRMSVLRHHARQIGSLLCSISKEYPYYGTTPDRLVLCSVLFQKNRGLTLLNWGLTLALQSGLWSGLPSGLPPGLPLELPSRLMLALPSGLQSRLLRGCRRGCRWGRSWKLYNTIFYPPNPLKGSVAVQNKRKKPKIFYCRFFFLADF